jgi:hypothetical protein
MLNVSMPSSQASSSLEQKASASLIAARGKAMDNEFQRWAALFLLIIGLGLVSYLLYVTFGPLTFPCI